MWIFLEEFIIHAYRIRRATQTADMQVFKASYISAVPKFIEQSLKSQHLLNCAYNMIEIWVRNILRCK